ncbi:serine/threonine-protein kinase [Pedobacter miscanthi]|uniref:serine/threonine-protein kinase n=1 Tax=Pedobacter miscanthi TaxID=2259170 RepID=UPI00292F2220|nr:serine/threonine-protein kinase [Pedobacter miscanthi]
MADNKHYKEKWVRIEDLAAGGQGTTIKAHGAEQTNKSVVAIKTLNKQNDPERRARMHRETTALATLSHPNIPKLIEGNTEFYEDHSYKLFFASEFINGNTLSDFDFSTYSFLDIIDLAIKIAEVVNDIHKQGFIHRDIKPDNIIIRDNNILDPVIIDFGISFNSNDLDNDNLTPDGQHIGNRFLILPEQKVGEAGKRDFRSDVSSILGLLFFMLTKIQPTISIDENGAKPHQRADAKAKLQSLPDYQRNILNKIFDIGFNDIISDRWQSAQSLIEQLHSLKNVEQKKDPRESAEIVERVKNLAANPNYEGTKYVITLLKSVDISAREALNELRKDLGAGDWGVEQSGGINHSGGVNYHNSLSLVNSVDRRFRTHTTIKAYPTGNELVIQVTEDPYKDLRHQSLFNRDFSTQFPAPVTTEIHRTPIKADIDWAIIRNALKNHYLQAIDELS